MRGRRFGIGQQADLVVVLPIVGAVQRNFLRFHCLEIIGMQRTGH